VVTKLVTKVVEESVVEVVNSRFVNSDKIYVRFFSKVLPYLEVALERELKDSLRATLLTRTLGVACHTQATTRSHARGQKKNTARVTCSTTTHTLTGQHFVFSLSYFSGGLSAHTLGLTHWEMRSTTTHTLDRQPLVFLQNFLKGGEECHLI